MCVVYELWLLSAMLHVQCCSLHGACLCCSSIQCTAGWCKLAHIAYKHDQMGGVRLPMGVGLRL